MSWARRIKDALSGGDVPAPPTAPPASAEHPSPADSAVRAALVAEIVRESEGRLHASEIDADGHMYDCGYVDSLSSVTLLGFIETRYGVEIEDTELVGRLDTITKLATFIEQAR